LGGPPAEFWKSVTLLTIWQLADLLFSYYGFNYCWYDYA